MGVNSAQDEYATSAPGLFPRLMGFPLRYTQALKLSISAYVAIALFIAAAIFRTSSAKGRSDGKLATINIDFIGRPLESRVSGVAEVARPHILKLDDAHFKGNYSLAYHFANLSCVTPGIDDRTLTSAMLELSPESIDSETIRAASGLPEGDTYFIVLLLHNNEDIIPTAMGELLKLIFILQRGPGDFGNVFVSIYESGSEDMTPLLLRSFQTDLVALGVPHRVVLGGNERESGEHRIHFLAHARNLAIEPMITGSEKWDHFLHINDVVTCASSLAELVAVKLEQSADLACAMDFVIVDGIVLYYVTWVGIYMEG